MADDTGGATAQLPATTGAAAATSVKATAPKPEAPKEPSSSQDSAMADTEPADQAQLAQPPEGELGFRDAMPRLTISKANAHLPEPASVKPTDKMPAEDDDVEVKDAAQVAPGEATGEPTAAPAEEPDEGVANEPAVSAPAADKSKARRKSTAAESKAKKLNKKSSRARIVHLDAKSGDHFFVKLKGYPPWPAIICDEDMLPLSLIKNRPVTAARPDGSYREDYADGGKKAADRTYPVMYLFTNELYVHLSPAIAFHRHKGRFELISI